MEELKAQLCEAVFNHRWVLLEGYHSVGKTLLASVRGCEARTEELGQKLGQRPKTIHYCIELAKKYPDLNSLPDGKNVSWYKICKTLPPYEKDSPPKKIQKRKRQA